MGGELPRGFAVCSHALSHLGLRGGCRLEMQLSQVTQKEARLQGPCREESPSTGKTSEKETLHAASH